MTQDSIAEQRDIPIQHHGIAKNDVIQDLNKEVDRMKDQMARLTARLERSEAEIRRLRKENCAASSASGTFGEKLERRSTPPLAKAHQTRSTQTKQGKAYGRGHRLTMVNGRYAGMHHHPQWRSLVRSIPQTGRNLNWETLHKLVVSHFDPHWPKARTQAFKQAGGEMAIDVCYDIQQDSKDARGTWTTLRKRVRLEAIQKFEDLCADHFPLELFADAWAAKQILTYTWNNMRPKKNNTSSESDSNEEKVSVQCVATSPTKQSRSLLPPPSLRRKDADSPTVVAPSPWIRSSSFPLPPMLYRDRASKMLICVSDNGKVDVDRIANNHSD